MPKNNITTGADGRKRYRYTDKTGKARELRQRKGESVQQFKKRCEQMEEVTTVLLTFSDLFRKWQSQHQKIYCSQGDILMTRSVYNLYLRDTIGHYKLHEITRPVVYDLLSDMAASGKSAALISKARSTISRPFNWAINTLGLDLVTPTAGLVMREKYSQKSKRKTNRLITEEELERFFENAKNSKYYNYFRVLQYTGLRPSEAAGLQVDDDKGKYLLIQRGITQYELSPLKTAAARRKIPVTLPLRRVLDDQKKKIKGKWLFPSAEGPPSVKAIRKVFYNIRDKEEADFTLYSFRHTFATNASRRLRPNQLQYLMGHSNISITLKYYIGLSDADHDEAFETLEKIFSEKTGQN